MSAFWEDSVSSLSFSRPGSNAVFVCCSLQYYSHIGLGDRRQNILHSGHSVSSSVQEDWLTWCLNIGRAMTNNKLIIFTGALFALYLMTVLSALLGWVVTTFIPREITYYTCTAIMFLFGLKMLWEAWRMKEDEVEETQKEVEQELAVMEGVGAAERGENNEGFSRNDPGPAILELSTEEQPNKEEEPQGTGIKSQAMRFLTKYIIAKHHHSDTDTDTSHSSQNIPAPATSPASQQESRKAEEGSGWLDHYIDRGCKENSWFGKKCLKIFKVKSDS